MLPPPRHVLIIGASAAGLSTAAALRAGGYAGQVRIIDADPDAPYLRPSLSKALDGAAGAAAAERADLLHQLQRDEVDLLAGAGCVSLDRSQRRAYLADGSAIDYDRLVLATGALARQVASLAPAVPLTLRTAQDQAALAAQLDAAKRVVVVGGGVLGTELGWLAHQAGRDVVVLEQAPALGVRVWGALAPALTQAYRRPGLGVRTRVQVTGAAPGKLHLADGDALAADLVLLAIGSAPNTRLAAAAGLDVSDGVLTDSSGRTSDPQIFCAGDAANWRLDGVQRRFEQFCVAQSQGACVAAAILGGDQRLDPPYMWSDQMGATLQAVGEPADAERFDIEGHVEGLDFLARGMRGGRLVALVSAGRPRAFSQARAAFVRGLEEASEATPP